jgi:hypothetical protein
VIPIERVREHVVDLARRLENLEVTVAALRGEIERARLHAQGLAAAMREP